MVVAAPKDGCAGAIADTPHAGAVATGGTNVDDAAPNPMPGVRAQVVKVGVADNAPNCVAKGAVTGAPHASAGAADATPHAGADAVAAILDGAPKVDEAAPKPGAPPNPPPPKDDVPKPDPPPAGFGAGVLKPPNDIRINAVSRPTKDDYNGVAVNVERTGRRASQLASAGKLLDLL